MRRIAIATLVVLAACGGGHKAKTTGTSLATTTTSGETVTTAPGGEVAGTSTTRAGTAGKTATTTGKTAATTKATSASGAPTPAAPGTYDYNQSGSSTFGPVPATGTMKVDAASASGVQVWHIYADPSQPSNDMTYAFRNDGPFVTDTENHQGGLDVKCHFDPPIPAPPWPATDGKPIKGHAVCGQITVDVDGKITGHRSATVDGKAIDVVVSTFTVTTHGQVESTTTTEDWWAASLRIPVHDHATSRGTFGAFAFQADTTRDLKSGTPH